MKLFNCTHCGQLLYFENDVCERCHYPLGFVSGQLQLRPLQPQPDGTVQLYNDAAAGAFRRCANHQYGVCNWLVPTASPTPYCTACKLNRTIPDLSKPEYLRRWHTIEAAKHRLVYSLLRLKLPVVSKNEDAAKGLSFDFVADESGQHQLLTGHAQGHITLNIAEADDVEREMARKAMAELYRTVLGHFRHEVGHYYWDRLIADSPHLLEFRRRFGDEQQDYGAALKRHYAQPAPPDWNQHYISAYATAHPWEDWAETWAHYLHIVDTLETAWSFGLGIAPRAAAPGSTLHATIDADPYQTADFARIMQNWLPLTFAMNSLNRSMGLPDPYPFVISAEVMEKLAFIHRVVRQ